MEIDESLVLDLSGHENSELEVVLDGGSMPTPAMVAWARELQVGSWYMLDRGGHSEPVQLAWHGMRKQLSLFVTPQARCVLFQQHRLASFLQAGLLLPAQDEALTVRATRSALAKLDVEPSVLLNARLSQGCRRAAGGSPFSGSGGPRASTKSSSRISASGSSPRLQKTISTMIFRSSSSIGPSPTAMARSITISRIGAGSTPADSRKR